MGKHRKEVFLDLARYNLRANGELYNVLATLTDKARHRETGSWFGSVHRLINHIVIADMFWLKRFRAIYPESRVLADTRLIPDDLSWSHALRDDFDELRGERGYVDDRLIDWFEECPEERYEVRFEYVDSAGGTRHAVASKAFEFLFVHQIHHRGQVSQILDELGLPNNIADNGAFLEATH
ncbi:MAG TPA: DinB family protein [Spirochaetia bacterium]|nr:DinB family protein [Spirochaetia bacterium]